MTNLKDKLGSALVWLFWIGIIMFSLANSVGKSPDQICEKKNGSLNCWDFADYQDHYYDLRF